MMQGRKTKDEKVIPYTCMSQTQRDEAQRVILTTVRDTLRKGPNSAIELRSRIPTQHLGAFHVVLECMIQAGEVASIGHSIYAQVPWMPATRPVQADAVMDIVFGALSKTIKVGATAVELASDLTLPKDVVRKALSTLESSGLIRETRQKQRYRLVSTRMAQHVRQGASGRIFADVRHG
ncbi:hypothetical protein [Acetobacter syzygii]|uniref:HTH iclR-type domain-containing protein n=1 Tax=Acetobacter syzygii TaxID=146476 RepID=A0A270B694_9PROT|nr:hypothetical protein [Acetobacter syzygii]NSL92997.1 hypothetical protein [Acetobacter syzygii]PAL20544.1 hypothetical protein B9K05_12925 [Acetobacter syzygii]PAL21104.1 hypothetical protein B9K04_13105 [Acetobacter syzygii]